MAYTGSKAFQGLGSQLGIGAVASAVLPTGLTGTATSGSTSLTLSAAPSTSIVGMGVSGTGLATGTTIVSGSGTGPYVLSAATTGALSATPLTFAFGYTPIFELTNQPFKPAEWDKLDVSNFNSGNFKEFIKGMIDSGTVPIEGNYVATDPGQIAVAAAFADKANAYKFQLTLPKQQGQTTSGDSFAFNALVMSWTPLGDFDPKKVVTIKGELQITGGITYTAGS